MQQLEKDSQSSNSEFSKDVEFFEYTKAANPLAKGTTPAQPFGELLSHLHESGPTRVINFDLSEKLANFGPATSANLAAAFVRIEPGESIETRVNATSELIFVMRGEGSSERAGAKFDWQSGDFLVLPGGKPILHRSKSDAALYWINDEPLLRYLGVSVSEERFSPTLYDAETCRRELARVAADPASKDRNRVSILLGNKRFPQTMTVTHTLWAMFGLLPKRSVQPPHRHNSVALDLILDCQPGCYTLISKNIDDHGRLIEPIKQEWRPNSAFVTPPYWWHSHHNESDSDAHVVPIQDAGLQTYMRTLNIEFAHR